MKFTALLFTLTISATAWASSPNPSNTNIRINTAPRLAISKSKVSSTLARAAVEPTTQDDAALHYLSNAIRDASTNAVKARGGMRGVRRRASRASEAAKAQHQSMDSAVQSDDQQPRRRNGMGKSRQ